MRFCPCTTCYVKAFILYWFIWLNQNAHNTVAFGIMKLLISGVQLWLVSTRSSIIFATIELPLVVGYNFLLYVVLHHRSLYPPCLSTSLSSIDGVHRPRPAGETVAATSLSSPYRAALEPGQTQPSVKGQCRAPVRSSSTTAAPPSAATAASCPTWCEPAAWARGGWGAWVGR